MDGPKAYDSIKEKNMPKSVGARTHPYFTTKGSSEALA